MKKLIIFLITLIVLGFAGYFIYVNYIDNQKIVPEEERVSISEYYIYGDHLNIKGSLSIDDMNYQKISLNLYNGEDKEFDILSTSDGTKIEFSLSETINDGLYIDNLDRGTYYLFLKLTYENEENKEKPIIKYYALDNTTTYKESIYYTLSKYNNKIVINSDNDYNTMAFNIKENKDKEIYDIAIDPGHGGMDSGGLTSKYKESDFTMAISQKIKKNLEASGLKVKLTHEEGSLTTNDLLDEYNKHGRAVIPNEVKSKYTFSIHNNTSTSSKVNGIEIYTPVDINYDLAKSIVANLVEYTGFDYSGNRLHKIYNGIYSHNFTDDRISSSLKGYEDKKYNPYKVTNNSNYYYMIRETGGYLTGAYVDDSNPDKVGVNPYYNTNIANESYLLELGYMTNSNDLNVIIENSDDIAKAISDAIIEKLSK